MQFSAFSSLVFYLLLCFHDVCFFDCPHVVHLFVFRCCVLLFTHFFVLFLFFIVFFAVSFCFCVAFLFALFF